MTRYKRLPRTWRPIKKHAFAVLDTILLDNGLGVAARVEGASEDFCELLVQTADAQLLKTDVLLEELLSFIRAYFDALVGLLRDFEAEDRVFVDYSEVLSASMDQSFYLLNRDFENDLALSDGQWE